MTAKVISLSTTQDRIDQIDAVASNRSEFINEAIDHYLDQQQADLQDQLNELESQINAVEKEQRELQQSKNQLQSQKEHIQKQIEQEQKESELYDDLIDDLAEIYENGYAVKKQEKFGKAVELCDFDGSVAEVEVLEEIEDRADVVDEETTESDDLDLDLDLGGSQ